MTFSFVFCSPMTFSLFNQISELIVAEQMLSGKAYQYAEREFPFQVSGYDSEEQIGNKRAPYLDFDGIFIVA